MDNLFLLCRKNFIVLRRRWINTLCIVLLPGLVTLSLLVVRCKTPREFIPQPTTWDSFNATLPASSPWALAYTPVSIFTNDTMGRVKNAIGVTLMPFTDENHMLKFLNSRITNVAGIIFHATDDVNKHISYSIRMHSSDSWETQLLFRRFPTLGPRTSGVYAEPPTYVTTGFLAVHQAIDSALIKRVAEQVNSTFNISVDITFKRLPYPPHSVDLFTLVLEQQLSLLVVAGFLFPAIILMKRILEEKNLQIREAIRMMGVSAFTYWMSWFLTFSLLFYTSSAIITGTLCIDFTGRGRILPLSDPSFVFCSLCIYSLSLIAFVLFLTTLFQSPNAGAAVSCTILALSFIPYQLISVHFEKWNVIIKWLACLMPNTAIAFIFYLIGRFEGVGVGAKWSLFFHRVTSDDPLRLDVIWSIVFFDILFFIFLTWYGDVLFPGKYGIPKPWHYPISGLLRYRLFSPGLETNAIGPFRATDLNELPNGGKQTDNSLSSASQHPFEATPLGLRAGIAIENLRKVYGRTMRYSPAVANVSMSAYEGEITVLLGHNGAGKTTLMSMLTGLLAPTSGSAHISGHSISTDIRAVRRNLSFCPQHNLFFDCLTVSQHLWLFARLKGVPRKEVNVLVSSMLLKVALHHKAHTLPSRLSNGAKRLLSVAMALIGNLKVVILDEPTSDLPPAERRNIWNILQLERPYRTILLSTRCTDEAEHLGDRIAVMAGGELKCFGSPFFLKSIFGTGYLLTIRLSSSGSGDEKPDIIDFVRKFVLHSKFYFQSDTELGILLPIDAVPTFSNLFSELELQKMSLGISGFVVSVVTMDEVLFRIAAQLPISTPHLPTRENTNPLSPPSDDVALSSTTPNSGDTHSLIQFNASCLEFRCSGLTLYLQQMYAMVYKRYAYAKRSPILTLSQLVIPSLCVLLANLIYGAVNDDSDFQPPVLISFSSPLFGNDIVVPTALQSNSSDVSGLLLKAYKDQFNPQQASFIDINQSTAFESIVLEKSAEDLHGYTTRWLTGLVAGSHTDDSGCAVLNFLVYFMGEAFHALPVAHNAVSNALLRFVVSSSTNKSIDLNAYKIETFNNPLDSSENEMNGELFSKTTWLNVVITGVVIACHVLAGASFLAASLVTCLTHERVTGAIHLQFLSGVRLTTYWCSMYLWDVLTYAVSGFFCFLVFVFFNLVVFAMGFRVSLVGWLGIAYGWAVIPFMYLISTFNNSTSSGLAWLTVVNFLTGVLGILITQLFCVPLISLQWLGLCLRNVFIILFPGFAFTDGFYSAYANFKHSQICDNPKVQNLCDGFAPELPCCQKTCTPYCAYWSKDFLTLDTPGIGRHLIAMACQGFFWGFWLLFTESTLAHRTLLWLKSSVQYLCYLRRDSAELQTARGADEDDYMVCERNEVQAIPVDRLRTESSLALLDVTKEFDGMADGGQLKRTVVKAVENCNMVMFRGECFGLLGVNGAGKSTLFQIITGKLDATNGRILVDGFDIIEQRRQAQRSIGFCPQFDALLDHLTCYETLHMFGRLRGLQDNGGLLTTHIEALMAHLVLTDYASVRVVHLSGKRRRLLSLAAALLGGPPLICLDELSSGMDPISRQRIWILLSAYRKAGSTIIVSSRSMDEFEALCTRIGVMVNGRFKVVGSCHHLESRFGQGYSISLQIRSPLSRTECAPMRSAIASPSSSFCSLTLPFTDDYDGTVDNEGNEPSVDIAAVNRVVKFLETEFPGIHLLDRHKSFLQFHLVDDESCLSRIFGLMELYKEELGISAYQVSQTKLEQVFVSLAQRQTDHFLPTPDNRIQPACLTSCWPCQRISSLGSAPCCYPCCRRGRQVDRVLINDDEISSLSLLT